LVQRFGKPTSGNAANWFPVANFLGYSTNALVVRTDTTNQRNAVASPTGTITNIPVTSGGAGYITSGVGAAAVVIPAPTASGGVQATATPVISGGVIQSITITNPGTGYDSVPVVTISGTQTTPAVVGTVTTAQGGVKINNEDHYLSSYSNGEGVVGEWAARFPGALGNSLTVSVCDAGGFADWAYKSQFNSAPGTSTWGDTIGATNDEVHVIVIDKDGRWTGIAGSVLERFPYLSKASDAKSPDGTSSYYKNNINTNSKYVWWMDHTTNVTSTGFAVGAVSAAGTYASLLATATGTITVTTSAATVVGVGTNFDSTYVGKKLYNATGVLAGTVLSVTDATHATLTANASVAIAGAAFKIQSASTSALSGGVDHLTSTDAQKMAAFDLMANAEQYDISLLFAGKANYVTANYLIQNIAEVRKDCMAFVSPEDVTTGSPLIGSTSDIADKIIAYRNLLTSSSYGFMDTGYKYQYDKYNDVYRWVPLNGDIAGLAARTDYTNDPWWSIAGYNRGQIKNVVKLAYNPTKTDRDNLYKVGVNPVVSFPGEGTVLFGDKTLQSKPSAFDRINVRRLFITIEKAISTAAKYQLFEFNDPYTRAIFVGMVSPYLRDVQGRRGITDFRVVADESNNTGEIVDTNQFVGDIYVKPTRSINFIQLNFVATRTGVSFSEIAGKTA
jgi:phage tail sheath protein FI